MNKENVNILDCTLRDGGRIIDCKFSDTHIKGLIDGLSDSLIDIVEVGFLRDARWVAYTGNSTFFSDTTQIAPFLQSSLKQTKYVVFADFGMLDISEMKAFDNTSISGIRLGFTRKDFLEKRKDLIQSMKMIQKLGYELYMQDVNTLGYSDEELLQLIDLANCIAPASIGIVDTYGAMYLDDLHRLYKVFDSRLNADIALDFHFHNNSQMAFALAQEAIKIASDARKVLVDASLNGMGKCAGNLNTELIVDFMIRKYGKNYGFDHLMDIIDKHIYPEKEKKIWGYSIPAFLGGVFQAHPNNIIYLTEKMKLNTKDIRYILSMIDAEQRERYDYDNIEQLYIQYSANKVDDYESIQELKKRFAQKKVLLMAPGSSLNGYQKEIDDLLNEEDMIGISVNFIYTSRPIYAFFGSQNRYVEESNKHQAKEIIVTSNIKEYEQSCFVVDYSSVIMSGGWRYLDNSFLMVLNFLKRLKIKDIYIAGLDGYEPDQDNFFRSDLVYSRGNAEHDSLNAELHKMLQYYFLHMEKDKNMTFVTPSRFAAVVEKGETPMLTELTKEEK